jgi:hypothetical protein
MHQSTTRFALVHEVVPTDGSWWNRRRAIAAARSPRCPEDISRCFCLLVLLASHLGLQASLVFYHMVFGSHGDRRGSTRTGDHQAARQRANCLVTGISSLLWCHLLPLTSAKELLKAYSDTATKHKKAVTDFNNQSTLNRTLELKNKELQFQVEELQRSIVSRMTRSRAMALNVAVGSECLCPGVDRCR